MPLNVEQPLAYYGALSAGVSACLYLFVSLGRQIQNLNRQVNRRFSDVDKEAGVVVAQIATLETRLGEWAGRTREVEERVSLQSPLRRPQTISTGVDANQRTQVLRLARRGDRPEQIAAELQVPKSEVELLLKVQRAMVRVF
jgi:hypothetical protein